MLLGPSGTWKHKIGKRLRLLQNRVQCFLKPLLASGAVQHLIWMRLAGCHPERPECFCWSSSHPHPIRYHEPYTLRCRRRAICLSAYLSIYLSIYPSIYPSACRSNRVFVYLRTYYLCCVHNLTSTCIT